MQEFCGRIERLTALVAEHEAMMENQSHQLDGRQARIDMLEQQLADAEVRPHCVLCP